MCPRIGRRDDYATSSILTTARGLRNQLAPQRPRPLRAPEAIWADIRALEQEGLLAEIRGGA